MKDKPHGTFILRSSNSDNKKSLSLTYMDKLSSLQQLKITNIGPGAWYADWEDEDGEVVDAVSDTVESLVERLMGQLGCVGINA